MRFTTGPKELHPHWKGGIPSWICVICKTTFAAYPRQQNTPRKYCSKRCLGCANGRRTLNVPRSLQVRLKLSAAFKGSKSHFWKGGVTPLNQIERESARYAEWRYAVFQRDKFTCQWCGATKNLNADHIKAFASFPSLRYELSNGRTLCNPCHRKTDTWGVRSNLQYA